MRMIKLTPEFLMERLQGKALLTSNLPNDIELLDIKYDLFANQVMAIVRSENFEDIAETYPIQEFVLTYSANPKTGPQTIAPAKPNVKPTTAFKAEPVAVKRVQISPKKNTSMMEEEFSQEQRKLLSFSVDGDYVVVKPIKFLKAEWDDINEVVRGLGGRWVKGDIISYWEIPLQPS
jgi:hypothetical protein